jgi:small nuclear ribonucleoprotein (snRNP)-like protein
MDLHVELPPSIDNVPPPGMALVEELDKTLLIQLRDGRKLIGIMRSFDQFANIVLEGTVNLDVLVFRHCLQNCRVF